SSDVCSSDLPDLLQKYLGGGNGIDLGLAQHPARRLDDVVEDAQVWPEVEILEDKADPGPQAVDLGVIGRDQGTIATGLEFDFLTGDQNLAGMRVFQQVDAT